MPQHPPIPPRGPAPDESQTVRARPPIRLASLSPQPSMHELAEKYATLAHATIQRLNEYGQDIVNGHAEVLVGLGQLGRRIEALEQRIAPGGEVEMRARAASVPAVEEIKAAVTEAIDTGRHDVVTPTTLELALARRDLTATKEVTADEKMARAKRSDRVWLVLVAVAAFVLERLIEWAAKGHP
jgi:hypothetical protein